MKGLRVRGGFEVDIKWDEEGWLIGGMLKSFLGNLVYLVVGGGKIGEEGGGDVRMLGVEGMKGMGRLEMKKGDSYRIEI